MIEHKMLKTADLKYSCRDGMIQIAKTIFSLWSLVKESEEINRITRHREEHGLNKNCNYMYLEAVDGNKTKLGKETF